MRGHDHKRVHVNQHHVIVQAVLVREISRFRRKDEIFVGAERDENRSVVYLEVWQVSAVHEMYKTATGQRTVHWNPQRDSPAA